jgi:hypothetical protein
MKLFRIVPGTPYGWIRPDGSLRDILSVKEIIFNREDLLGGVAGALKAANLGREIPIKKEVLLDLFYSSYLTDGVIFSLEEELGRKDEFAVFHSKDVETWC